MEFSEKLKDLRSEKGVSQAKLAEDIHISRSAVAKWENGLGLPNDESLKLLAQYFGVSVDALLADKDNEAVVVSKNKMIAKQRAVIIAMLIGILAGILIFLCIHIEELRDSASMVVIGAMLVILGVFNMKGNIATIHWYNRRKVTKENQKPYCRLMGLGTLLVGVCLFAGGIVNPLAGEEIGANVQPQAQNSSTSQAKETPLPTAPASDRKKGFFAKLFGKR